MTEAKRNYKKQMVEYVKVIKCSLRSTENAIKSDLIEINILKKRIKANRELKRLTKKQEDDAEKTLRNIK